MPTIQQLVRFERLANKKKTKSPALKSCPQRRRRSLGGTEQSSESNEQNINDSRHIAEFIMEKIEELLKTFWI